MARPGVARRGRRGGTSTPAPPTTVGRQTSSDSRGAEVAFPLKSHLKRAVEFFSSWPQGATVEGAQRRRDGIRKLLLTLLSLREASDGKKEGVADVRKKRGGGC
ncbi:hypothetical protein OPV22_026617 [Ensete ventricosum]|uniref:Uncharacterized protein n=1 Tax=Ensete ventricosum TaxID=4639 RepID=A0AAV8Q705_ENSVE|nr:hypothetical protein OPV22_026617 [Ensete ventricosum]RWV89776.1 hypothetical protein GW17_00048062 [Ensete ventricosum]RZS13628.1 hypothetical protein BHM03_00045233 [Ensete ventricosum]